MAVSSLDDYVNSLKTGIVTLGVETIYRLIVVHVPFLGWPIISYVVKAALKRILTEAADGGEFLAFAKYIDVRVTAEGRRFSEAALANHHAQLHGTKEEKAYAEKVLRTQFASFAKLGPK